jgi:hypothetical protein
MPEWIPRIEPAARRKLRELRSWIAYAVYDVLAQRARPDGRGVIVSRAALAHELGVTEKSIRFAYRKLITSGLASKTVQGHRYRCSEFRVLGLNYRETGDAPLSDHRETGSAPLSVLRETGDAIIGRPGTPPLTVVPEQYNNSPAAHTKGGRGGSPCGMNSASNRTGQNGTAGPPAPAEVATALIRLGRNPERFGVPAEASGNGPSASADAPVGTSGQAASSAGL